MKILNGLILISAKSEGELSSIALSTINAQSESGSMVMIVSKRERFTEADLIQVKAKSGVYITHFYLDGLDVTDSSRLIFEALKLSPRIIYLDLDDFDYRPIINLIMSVAECSHLIILGMKNRSPSQVIKELASNIHNPHEMDAILKMVIAPSYKEHS